MRRGRCGAFPRRAGQVVDAARHRRRGQHRRRHDGERPGDLTRPRHGHVHAGRGDRPGAGLGPRRRVVAGDGRARPLRGGPPGRVDAATTWFRLGDRDLATHLYRTAAAPRAPRSPPWPPRSAGPGRPDHAAADDRRTVATVLVLPDGSDICVPGLLRSPPARRGGRRRAVRDNGAGDRRPGARCHRDRGRRCHRPVQPVGVDRPAARPARRRRRCSRPAATRSSPCHRSSAGTPSRARPSVCSSSSDTRHRWWASPGSTRRSPPPW